jgi:tRNA threonylcarbamoyladenosine biosynthesis protein TsaE
MADRFQALACGAGDMRELGARLAGAISQSPKSGSLLITLVGELGAGKTTLVGGLLNALGHVGPVRSPTYTLLEPYQIDGRDIVHCDLYRLRHPDELEDLGLRDLRGPGSVLLVEWPDRAGGQLGPVDLSLALEYAADEARSVAVEAATPAGRAVLAAL